MKKKFDSDEVPLCKECSTELIEKVNWPPSRKMKGHFVCNNCVNKKIQQRKNTDPTFKENSKKYHRIYNSSDERKAINKVRSKLWKDNNVEWVKQRDRISSLKRKYNMTIDEYDELLKLQGNVCAICGTDTPTGVGTFHVDHNHITGKIRGILCSKCNHSLGLFNDDKVILLKAYNYLLNEGYTNEM